jgi:hypothetical protein
MMGLVKKGPDVSLAARVGDPTLVDPTPVSANQVAGESMRQALGMPAGEKGISVETVKSGTPGANEPAPRSDAPAPAASGDLFAHPAATTADPNELKPTVAPDSNALNSTAPPDPNELKPNVEAASSASNVPVAPPVQVNEIQQAQSSSSSSGAVASADSSSNLASDQDISSSKKKKKKGLKKVVSF